MRHHKYNAKPVTIDNIRFASGGEGKRYAELKLLERAGEISELRLQPSFDLRGADGELLRYCKSNRIVRYVADFMYTEQGVTYIEDYKGFDTPASKLKRAIMASMGFPVTVIK